MQIELEKFIECALARDRDLLLVNVFDLAVHFTQFEELPTFPKATICADHVQRQLIIATKDSGLLLCYDSQRLWAAALGWKYGIQIMQEFPWNRWISAHKHLSADYFSFLPERDEQIGHNNGALRPYINEKPLIGKDEGLSI